MVLFNHELLQEKLNEKGLSNNQLDKRMDNVGMAYKYTNGTNTPSPDLLIRFLLAMGYTNDDLTNERLTDWYRTNGSD
jgi:hypothetical protein